VTVDLDGGAPSSKKVKTLPIEGSEITVTGNATSPPDNSTPTEFPAAWFKQEAWRRNVIPTLCLWAAAQADVWAISKDKIVDVLKAILPVAFPQFAQLPDRLNVRHRIVAVVWILVFVTNQLSTNN
jgi:hypothetical protein